MTSMSSATERRSVTTAPPAGLLLLVATSAGGLVSLGVGEELAAAICLFLILAGSLVALWRRGRRR
jgi:hypothetical protein